MTNKELDKYLRFARQQTDLSRSVINANPLHKVRFYQKPDQSLVTEVDKKIETLIRQNITSIFPDHGIIGEEFPQYSNDSKFQWIIDPIDGTQEYINGSPLYGFILSLHYAGNPVLGIVDHPSLDIRCEAVRGCGTMVNGVPIRLKRTTRPSKGAVMPARADFCKYHDESNIFAICTNHFSNFRVYRSCYGHTSTLLGHTSLTIEHDVQLWDISATQILIEEAGGRFHVLRQKLVQGAQPVFSVVFGESTAVEYACNLLDPLYS